MYYHKNNNETCYCLNRNQLCQYWQCVVKDRGTFCPGHCDSYPICKETNAFVELQVAYIFCPNTTQANNQESKPYQPVL